MMYNNLENIKHFFLIFAIDHIFILMIIGIMTYIKWSFDGCYR